MPQLSAASSESGTVRKRGNHWTYFTALSGAEGQRWLEGYGAVGGFELTQTCQQAVDLLRRRDIAEGHELLQQVEERALPLKGRCHESVFHVLWRWHRAALAYFHYCRDEFDAAGEALDEAHESVRAAIQAEPVLTPLAPHCYEFRLQYARIARGRHRWEEMWRHLDSARAMLQNQLPLCVLRDGTSIFYTTLARLFNPLSAFAPEDQILLRALLEQEGRLRYFESRLHRIYTPPGFIIPYP